MCILLGFLLFFLRFTAHTFIREFRKRRGGNFEWKLEPKVWTVINTIEYIFCIHLVNNGYISILLIFVNFAFFYSFIYIFHKKYESLDIVLEKENRFKAWNVARKKNRIEKNPSPTPNNVSYLHMLTFQYKVKEKNKKTANRYKVFYPNSLFMQWTEEYK